MEDLKSGFYTTSKMERKPEAMLSQSSFNQSQSFSFQSRTQTQEELKQSKKFIHAIILTSQEKPKKTKSTLHQEISEFIPSSQMSMEHLIKAIQNLQKEIMKLKKDNEKLIQHFNPGERLKSRIMFQEREISAFWNKSQNQNSESQNKIQIKTELDNKLEKKEETATKNRVKQAKK